jgi:hypothetical protein
MAFSRKSMVASVAGSLSLAMLTGCPAPNPVTPSVSPSAPASTPASTTTNPSPSTSASTGTTPSATPSSGTSSPGATGSATPSSTAPTASAPPPSTKTTIVSGTVYDETAATVDGAVVKVTSLDQSVPYSASTTTNQGSWVVNSVPEGANVEIVVTKDGWTSRRRVGSFQTNANQKNTVDFGGTGATTGSGTDTSGIAYFISKYPEITAVDPGYDANNVDNSTISYKLTLSEPLDSTNQNRFAAAIRLFPANQYSAQDNAASATEREKWYATDLKDKRLAKSLATADEPKELERFVDPAGTYPAKNAAVTVAVTGKSVPEGAGPNKIAPNTADLSTFPWDYTIKSDSTFLEDANTKAQVTWDATGQVATLTFNAPLQSDRTNQARYQVGLVQTSDSGERIVDKDNNQLGLGANGSTTSYEDKGKLIHATVKDPDLSLSDDYKGSGQLRWIGTHWDAARFAVKVDAVDPHLVSVSYSKLSTSSRFELTFDKVMAAYNGRKGGHVGDDIRTGVVLNKISFAVSDRTGGTSSVNLKGNAPSFWLDPTSATQNYFGKNSGASEIEKEFYLADATQGGDFVKSNTNIPDFGAHTTLLETYGKTIAEVENDGTKKGHYLLAINPSNPRQLFIYLVGVTKVFGDRIVEMKVRAEGVPDASGNRVRSADADANQKTATITP